MHPIYWCRKEYEMPVLLMMEWDHPKDMERLKKQFKFNSEVWGPYWQKLIEEKGIKVESSDWSDNTGHKVFLVKFETMEDFSKAWEDEGHQQRWAAWAQLADNVRIRLLRPGLVIPEEFWI